MVESDNTNEVVHRPTMGRREAMHPHSQAQASTGRGRARTADDAWIEQDAVNKSGLPPASARARSLQNMAAIRAPCCMQRSSPRTDGRRAPGGDK